MLPEETIENYYERAVKRTLADLYEESQRRKKELVMAARQLPASIDPESLLTTMTEMVKTQIFR